jgi:signal transduction histidine kinase
VLVADVGRAEATLLGLGLGFMKAVCRAGLRYVNRDRRLWLVAGAQEPQVAQEGEQSPDAGAQRQARALRHEIGVRHRAPTRRCSRPSASADLANQAKSRYISSISTSCARRSTASSATPSCWADDEACRPHRRQAVDVIRRGGDHLLSLIEGTLDIARIEGGKLRLDVKPLRFREVHAADRAHVRAAGLGKGLAFRHEVQARCPSSCAPTRSACARC